MTTPTEALQLAHTVLLHVEECLIRDDPAAIQAGDVQRACAAIMAAGVTAALAQPQPSAPADALAEMEARKDAAYLERNQVVAALAKAYPSGVARTAIEGWSEDWHGCVYIDLPTGQASWHFHDSQAYLFDGLPAYAGKWDGHDTPEKYRRLASLKPQPSAASVEPHPLTLLQAGFNNAELLAQWRKKLPGVEPTDHELSAFAVGTEVGWERARDIDRQDWSRVHHALAKHGKHPGRTDDHLADVIDRALSATAPTAPAPLDRSMVRRLAVQMGIIPSAAQHPAPTVPEWRPIETAPRDGKPLLLWVDTDDGGAPMVLYRDKKGRWLYEGEPTYCHGFRLDPTHWMPLPAAPQEPQR